MLASIPIQRADTDIFFNCLDIRNMIKLMQLYINGRHFMGKDIHTRRQGQKRYRFSNSTLTLNHQMVLVPPPAFRKYLCYRFDILLVIKSLHVVELRLSIWKQPLVNPHQLEARMTSTQIIQSFVQYLCQGRDIHRKYMPRIVFVQ